MTGYRLSAFALVFLVAAFVVACGGSSEPDVTRTDEGVLRLGSVEAVDTVSRSVAPNDRLLVLEGTRGSVELEGAMQANADLTFVLRGRGEDTEASRSVLDGIEVREQGSDAEYVYTWTADDEDYASVDVRGTVPQEASLRVDRMGGPVQIVDVEGALSVQHQHGSVDVRGAAGDVEVDIENGSIRADFRAFPSEGPLQLQTNNGDIHVGLPDTGAVAIDAQTDVGTIGMQDVSLTTDRFAPVNAGARYEGRRGEGGPTLEVRTQNGSITIQPSDTTRADTTEVAPTPFPDTTVAPGGTPDTILPDTTAPDTTEP